MGVFLRAAGVAAVIGLGLILFGCAAGTREQQIPAGAVSSIPISASTSGLPVMRQMPYSGEMRVMSFNIRVKTFIDALGNSWNSRKNLLVQTIRENDPEIIGTQESMAEQSDFIREQLFDYDFVGVGRDDGDRRGEMCGVFFKSARFSKIASGHFWLSETPDVPGSRSWGSSFTRMVTWVKLRPRDGSAAFCVFNTHFDVYGARARVESARLLRRRMQTLAPGMPCIITGDFNDSPGSEPYMTLLGRQLVDAFRATHPKVMKGEGTRHDFKGGSDGPRIDWIVTTAGFQPVEARIIYTNQNGKFPSDHFPVTAVLRPVSGAAIARLD